MFLKYDLREIKRRVNFSWRVKLFGPSMDQKTTTFPTLGGARPLSSSCAPATVCSCRPPSTASDWIRMLSAGECGEETVGHFLADCPAYLATRRRLLGPTPSLEDILAGLAEDIVEFLRRGNGRHLQSIRPHLLCPRARHAWRAKRRPGEGVCGSAHWHALGTRFGE